MQNISQPRAERLLDRIVVSLNAIGSLWVMLLVLLICADSFGRSFFAHPIEGVTEMVAVSMAVIVFCQLPDTIRLNRLTRSDTLMPLLTMNNSVAGRVVLAGFEALGALIMAMIVVGMLPQMIEAYERSYYIGNRGIFTFPEWPLKALVVLGATLSMLCFLVRTAQTWRASNRI
jgi:TRAP-type mannitol/chloroaromatic compound transport system permease small subunit